MTNEQKLDLIEILRGRMNEIIQELSVLEQEIYKLTHEEDSE